MELNFRRYETKTLAELLKLDDKLVKELGVLGHKFAGLQQRIDALRATKRKTKRANK
jgi:hypothetical protein